MNLITLIYILNATLLLLHEIESAYEKEWQLLRLPVRISGFLLLHIPILVVLFLGLVEIDKLSVFGLILGVLFGIGGIVPFLVHKIFVKREGRFDLLISNLIIYFNVPAGVLLAYLSIALLLDPP